MRRAGAASRAEIVSYAVVSVVESRRAHRGIPRCRFASLCGMHRNTYTRLLQQEAPVSVDFLISASQVLCVKPEQLLQEAQAEVHP